MKYSLKTWENAINECLYGRKNGDGTIIWLSPSLLEILQSSIYFDCEKGIFNGFECFNWPKDADGYDKARFYIVNNNELALKT